MLPLDGVKILDMTQFLAGPYCTMVLADMGAEVTKIERFPSGDDSRRLAPFVNGESYCAAMPNRNKKSLALDLKHPRGKEVFFRLAEKADVIVENFRPGTTQKLGVDYDAVKTVNPDIIYCSISGFGQTGPLAHQGGFDIIAQGFTGLMRMTGEPGGRPAKVGIAIADLAAGNAAAQGILAAYVHRLRTGEGQYLETSLVDAVLAWTVWESGAYFGGGELPEATGTRHRRSTPYQAYRTQDGYVTVGAGNQRLWERFCRQVIERPEWIEDPRFLDLGLRMKHIDELEREIEAITVQRPTAYWVAKLDEAGVPGGPVYRYDEVLAHPQVLAREMVVELDHPIMGRMRSLGLPVKFQGTPLAIRTPGPWLGQHTTETLREAGYSLEEIQALYDQGVVYDKYPDRHADA
ncbi:CaiB/BaiF CoA transferase family protein [Alicyclobacillus macrosporangiidus]|uniref:CaiB/BaiF CoA transferase family protein n=1 Tax=Alicyclobacillus macrosporangiidus TaxID=392015 RepID=UPI000495A256|nr:CoA transferase [Alicyclobacillus macrosporangiidus]